MLYIARLLYPGCHAYVKSKGAQCQWTALKHYGVSPRIEKRDGVIDICTTCATIQVICQWKMIVEMWSQLSTFSVFLFHLMLFWRHWRVSSDFVTISGQRIEKTLFLVVDSQLKAILLTANEWHVPLLLGPSIFVAIYRWTAFQPIFTLFKCLIYQPLIRPSLFTLSTCSGNSYYEKL